ncbi:hypothetical protein NQ317_006505, partial [Molorchus minor]
SFWWIRQELPNGRQKQRAFGVTHIDSFMHSSHSLKKLLNDDDSKDIKRVSNVHDDSLVGDDPSKSRMLLNWLHRAGSTPPEQLTPVQGVVVCPVSSKIMDTVNSASEKNSINEVNIPPKLLIVMDNASSNKQKDIATFLHERGTNFPEGATKSIFPRSSEAEELGMCENVPLFGIFATKTTDEALVEAANIAISNLLPTKSRSLYDIAYNRFKKWCAEKNVQVYSENVLLAYFSENAKNYKSSTLWAQYSMVKSCLIIYDNIDISKFPKLIAFLKRTGDGYQAKKSKILTKSEIDRFLSSADDKDFLMIKVGLILGIAGACRTDELVNLTVDDIEDRLFLYYKAGKCSSQPVGKNTMGKIPSVVASYLKLPDVACYTGHCLRRSSATLVADAGVDITTIKHHAGWKSTTVAEGYVENSIENKTKIANQVLVGVEKQSWNQKLLDSIEGSSDSEARW